MKKIHLLKILKRLQIVFLILAILSLSIWTLFVANGFFRLGYLPKYGDPEFVLFNTEKIHFLLLIVALYITFFGTITWLILLLLRIVLKMDFLSFRNAIIGAIGFGLNFLFMFTPQFVWILD